jgi:hypothetical protein
VRRLLTVLMSVALLFLVALAVLVAAYALANAAGDVWATCVLGWLVAADLMGLAVDALLVVAVLAIIALERPDHPSRTDV